MLCSENMLLKAHVNRMPTLFAVLCVFHQFIQSSEQQSGLVLLLSAFRE